MKTVVKFLLGDYMGDSRDKREVAVLQELGYDVIIVQPGNVSQECNIGERVVLRIVKILPVLTAQHRLYRYGRILINWLVLADGLKKIKPHLISCHDLGALFIGWMSTWFIPKKKRPKLVYDAHEFEAGRNTGGKRGRLAKLLIPGAEKFLMKKCAFSIMVNDSIANAVQEAYGLKERPVVVRNIPPYWEIDEKVCAEKRRTLCGQPEALGVFLVMYHGAVMPGRGLETLLQVIHRNEHIQGIILGSGEEAYINALKEKAVALGLEKRLLFHEAVPVEELWKYVGAADISMITIPNISPSYFYMLPNKLFESIQALTPVIASAFPEVSRIVKKYDIGLLVDPDNVEEIANAIEKMRSDRMMYLRFKENMKTAKQELCWENEKSILADAYSKIL